MADWHDEADGVKWREENLPNKKLFSCLIRIPLPANVSKKTGLTVAFETTRVLVRVKGAPLAPCLEGELSTAIKTEESTWTIESDNDERVLMLEMCTREPGTQAWQRLFKEAAIVVEKHEEEDRSMPKLDMAQIKKQRDAENGFGRIRVKGVEEMEARAELNKLALQQPVGIQESVVELLDQGATGVEVLALLKQILGEKSETKE